MPPAEGVRIRPYRAGDGKALADLHRAAILAMAGDGYSPEQLKRWAAGLTNEGYEQAIAEGQVIEVAVGSGDDLLGFCSRTADEVKGLYVHPDHQGQGIGAALLTRAEVALKSFGIRHSKITASIAAAGFYKRQGYRIAGHIDHPTRGGGTIPAIVMEKELR